MPDREFQSQEPASGPAPGGAAPRSRDRARVRRRHARRRTRAAVAVAWRVPVRPRRQRPHAGPHRALPLRGARRVPADGGARRAGRGEEGRLRHRAQCARGQPIPRRDGPRRGPFGNRARHPPAGSGARCRHRPPVPADADLRRSPSRGASRLEARQRDPERREGTPPRAPRTRRGHRLQGHQPADQGPRAGNPGRGLPRRRGPGRRLAPLPRRIPDAGRLLGGPARSRPAPGATTHGRCTTSTRRLPPAGSPTSVSIRAGPTGAGMVVRRTGDGGAAVEPARDYRAAATPCGGSAHATSSRTSR